MSLAIAWGDVFEPTVRHVVIAFNLAAVVGLAAYAVFALRRTKHDEPSQNLTPFLDDGELEGPRLERVQGWALLFAAIVAVALPAYWLREPTRQDDSSRIFGHEAEERGKVLFSNKAMESYDSAISLGCADCHGTDGGGGAANSVQLVDGKKATVSWKAPALDTVLYRFSPSEITTILNYGRPGTPMGAWGVEGGGPKNAQSIQDLVAYLISIQIAPDEAQAKADEDLAVWRQLPRKNVDSMLDAQAAANGVSAKTDEYQTGLDAGIALTDVAIQESAVTAATNAKQDATDAVVEPAQYFKGLTDYRDASYAAEDDTGSVDSAVLDAAYEKLLSAAQTALDGATKAVSDAPDPETRATAEADAASAQAYFEGLSAAPAATEVEVSTARAARDAAQVDLDRATGNLDGLQKGITVANGTATMVAARYDAGKAKADAQINLAAANLDLANARTFVQRRTDVTEGQLLFEVNCARCHTKGWSFWDITQALPEDVIGPPGGGGQTGFNLRDGSTLRRFPDDPLNPNKSADGCGSEDLEYDSVGAVIDPKSGCATQSDFVVNGSDANKAYGNGGFGNGRMPGQCNEAVKQDKSVELEHYGCRLTSAQITAIVDYERNHLDDTTADLATADPDSAG